ncbi:hypothetical protein ASPCAL14904 [Aspergillus calidoustus]|uniref:Uncharacterized protein n=1 Tax=Aspergillus calidoustus TaxID=454130 RepID=A0A0U5GJ59_ASPCI|nr:hypothetical protein ASPCAL14904 [Aspergillus calidoustus]
MLLEQGNDQRAPSTQHPLHEYEPNEKHDYIQTAAEKGLQDGRISISISNLDSILSIALNDLRTGDHSLSEYATDRATIQALSLYRETTEKGLLVLMGKSSSIHNSQRWQDALDYCRAVIEQPQDSTERATGTWSRSCSPLVNYMKARFSPGVIEAARRGCAAIIDDHYGGDPLSIAHVDKKANTAQHRSEQKVGLPYLPSTSLLNLLSYEMVALCCAVAVSAWLPPKEAVTKAPIAHLAVADDYHAFTKKETMARARLVAHAVGVVAELGVEAACLLTDGSALQESGTGNQMTVEAVLHWRAVGGCTSPYSCYHWNPEGPRSLENGTVMPIIIMAMHDLLDWRSDTAAGNHENGVSALYGLGEVNDPHHVYLEGMLRKANTHPMSGAYALAAIVFLHYTSVRYGSYRPKGKGAPCGPCSVCEKLLKEITLEAGLQWAPAPPPRTFAASEYFRGLAKRVVDRFEELPLAQYGISWFQYLVISGEIHVFDALVKIDQLDCGADWA